MLNPYVKFEPRFLDAFIKAQDVYLVSQTLKNYHNIFNGDKIPILLSQYNDKGLALLHKKALKGDKYASIIELKLEKHYDKIKSMLQPDSVYEVWALLVQDRAKTETALNKKYAYNIRNWITRNTNWRIPAGETVVAHLNFIFGEMFLVLKYGKQSRQVPLSDIEKY